jgi:hypothetical protein
MTATRFAVAPSSKEDLIRAFISSRPTITPAD